MKVQVDHSHYQDLEYNEKGRFCSYWHQINEALSLKASTALEIGTGNGFVNFALKGSGINVKTIDIDKNLNPDYYGSVTEMPIPDKAFDIALCCQVLEHLPYENFVPALKEIGRVVRSHLILSLPDLRRVYRFNLQLPLLGEIKFLYPIPRLKPLNWKFNGEHYWNISCKGYSQSRIKQDIEKAGFVIEKNYCVLEMPWHRFFVLRKV
jgi:ubiquinone/menaquinone biosynthesis C-methylase UbiE